MQRLGQSLHFFPLIAAFLTIFLTEYVIHMVMYIYSWVKFMNRGHLCNQNSDQQGEDNQCPEWEGILGTFLTRVTLVFLPPVSSLLPSYPLCMVNHIFVGCCGSQAHYASALKILPWFLNNLSLQHPYKPTIFLLNICPTEMKALFIEMLTVFPF